MSYIIKEFTEDFKVFEISNVKLKESGYYAYFKIKKRDYNTNDVVKRIAEFLRLPLKSIGFAGNKDKKAITEQVISIKKVNSDVLDNFIDDNIEISFLGRGDEPISLGDLIGNRFEIVVRDFEKEPRRIKYTINYFDEQRFSRNNVNIGLAILSGDFKTAVEVIDDPKVNEYLNNHSNDFVGALKCIQFRLLMLYIHSVSSFIFNEITAEYLQCKYDCFDSKYSQGTLKFPKNIPKEKNTKIPIIGYATTYPNNEIKNIAKKILKKYQLKERNFIIKQIPALSNEGDERNIITEIKNLNIKKESEKKIKISFEIPKGSYATIVIRNLFL